MRSLFYWIWLNSLPRAVKILADHILSKFSSWKAIFGDSQLGCHIPLVTGNQITDLSPDLSFSYDPQMF